MRLLRGYPQGEFLACLETFWTSTIVPSSSIAKQYPWSISSKCGSLRDQLTLVITAQSGATPVGTTTCRTLCQRLTKSPTAILATCLLLPASRVAIWPSLFRKMDCLFVPTPSGSCNVMPPMCTCRPVPGSISGQVERLVRPPRAGPAAQRPLLPPESTLSKNYRASRGCSHEQPFDRNSQFDWSPTPAWFVVSR